MRSRFGGSSDAEDSKNPFADDDAVGSHNNPFASMSPPSDTQAPSSSIADFYSQMASADEDGDDNPFAAMTTSASTVNDASLTGNAQSQSQSSSQSSALFRIEREDGWRPSKDHGSIVSLASGNNNLLIGTSTNYVIRYNVDPAVKKSPAESILLSKRVDDAIHRVFLDPYGNHGIISMTNGINYYLHRRWSKAHALTKTKGIVIDSIAWNPIQGTDKNSSKILVGSSKGLIYELVLDEKDKDKSFRKLFDLNDGDGGLIGQAGSIHGLALEMFPDSGDESASNSIQTVKWLCIAATPTRQYQFIGGPKLENIFEGYSQQPRFQELPGALNRSELRFYSKKATASAPLDEPPSLCAWLTGAGIYYGDLNWNNTGEEIIDNGELLAYPESPDTKQPIPPIALICTEFHFLLLTNNELIAINELSKEIVHEAPVDSRSMGEPRGLSWDPTQLTIWLYTSKSLYEVIVEGEDREVWKLYLSDGDYDTAYEYCDNDEQREIVTQAHATYLIKMKKYREAAKKMAKTKQPFEEVALTFVHLGQINYAPTSTQTSNDSNNTQLLLDAREALKIYLLEKLRSLPPSAKTQQTMICTWLTEIFLDNLNNLGDTTTQSLNSNNTGNNFTPFLNDLTASTNTHSETQLSSPFDDPYSILSAEERRDAYVTELEEFHGFLSEFNDCLNKSTTIELLSSHGRLDEWFELNIDIDVDWLLTYRIQHKEFDLALKTLESYPQPLKILDSITKFAPALIHERPHQTVDILIATKGLDPAKLIPALMRYDDDTDQAPESEAIRFLEHSIYKQRNREPIVHNYLIALYARMGDNVPLLRYLESQRASPVFDAQYALRLCYEHEAKQACVSIYSIMGLHEQAVTLAITFDIPLAKRVIQQASQPSEENHFHELDPLTSKRLWLLIARSIISRHTDNIPEAMELLKDCGSLSLEDLLPFFPDTIRIGQLKDEIARSLDAYNKQIETLKSDMERSTRAAGEIKDDLTKLKARSATISKDRKCDLCGTAALTQPFYLFPSCFHLFHADCAKKEIVQYWEKYPAIKKRIVAERVALEKEKQSQAMAMKHSTQTNAHGRAVNAAKSGQLNQIDALFHGASASTANGGESGAGGSSGSNWFALSKSGKEQCMLDDFSCSECCLCGIIAIDSVQQPFIAYQDENEQRLIQLWSI